MAQRAGGPWLTVGKIIELFTAMGCTLGEVSASEGAWRIRYLYSPTTDDFVPITDLEDDEFLSPTELENWERRLGIQIPKGQSH